jgi:chromosome segregation ATPase
VRLIEAQIKDLGATNLQAFDLVTTELRRLEKRVKQVEDAMP